MPKRHKKKSDKNDDMKTNHEQENNHHVASPKKQEECHCQASVHPLINNCINCGRIVCKAEDSGPCLTCGNLVCTNEEQGMLLTDTPSSLKLRDKLMPTKMSFQDIGKIVFGMPPIKSPALEKAVSYKDRLLNYDKTVKQRTLVIDDAADYSSQGLDKWLSTVKREEYLKKEEAAHEMRHSRQQPTMLTIDFAGRQVLEEPDQFEYLSIVDEILKNDISIFDCPATKDLIDENAYHPKYVDVRNQRSTCITKSKNEKPHTQNNGFHFMCDEGMCLSIQQPYASLVLAGIKRHEGRHWYTSYRGRLWIRSSAKEPTERVISVAENSYNQITGATEFPKKYTCGRLLGCVDLIDCLPQDQYREKFPKGEIGAAYVFILETPRELRIKIPMPGKRNIFRMEGNFHEAAKKTLMKLGCDSVEA